MYSEPVEPRTAALAATLKVLARWAPHARHDVLGACSPISLDISVLGVKSVKGPLTADDVSPLVERSKANLRNVVQQLDRMVLFQRQDRRHRTDVRSVMEKMVHSMRTLFTAVHWEEAEAQESLGADSEYDLTMAIWAALMALYDKHGANMALHVGIQREGDALLFAFSVTPAVEDGFTASIAVIPDQQRIAIDEACHLAEYLDFTVTVHETGMSLRRAATGPRTANNG